MFEDEYIDSYWESRSDLDLWEEEQVFQDREYDDDDFDDDDFDDDDFDDYIDDYIDDDGIYGYPLD